jgi:hypothetical protein
LDTQNLWINLKHSLAEQDRIKIYNIAQELESNNYFFDVTNDTVLSYDDIKDKKCKYLTIAHPFDDRINAESPDLTPIHDQTPYNDLLTLVSKITKQAMNDFNLDRDIMFHCANIIFIPANSTFVPHIDSFRKCNISFPLALEGSTTYWLTPDRYETVYNTTTILNTEIKHSVENKTSKHRFVFQLNFKPNLGINDIRGNFDEYVK